MEADIGIDTTFGNNMHSMCCECFHPTEALIVNVFHVVSSHALLADINGFL